MPYPSSVVWYCGHCGNGPMSRALNCYCSCCSREMDAYATFEDDYQPSEGPRQVVSSQGKTRTEQWKTLSIVTMGLAEGEKEEERLEDNSSPQSSSANTGSIQPSFTDNDSHQDKDDETREQVDEIRDSSVKRPKTTSRLLERLSDPLTLTFTELEQDEQKIASGLVSLEDDTFSEALGSTFDYHNFEKDVSLSIPSKIDEYLVNLLPNLDITVNVVPGTSTFALHSHRRRPSFTPEDRQETAKTRKERSICDECKKMKVRCTRRSAGADCEHCTKMNRSCRRSNKTATSLGSQSSSQQVNERGAIQEDPETSFFDAEIDATIYEQDAVVPDPELQPFNSDIASLREIAHEDSGISAFDAAVDATMYDQDLVIPDIEVESMMSHQVDIGNIQDSRLLPALMLSESLEVSNLSNLLDVETNSMFPTYSTQPLLHVPSIPQNRETMIMAAPNLDPSQNFDSSSFAFGNEFEMPHYWNNSPPEMNHHRSHMFSDPSQFANLPATSESYLNTAPFENLPLLNAEDGMRHRPQLPRTENEPNFYDQQFDVNMYDVPNWYIGPNAHDQTLTATTSPSGMYRLATETPGFTPSSFHTGMLDYDDIATPPMNERFSGDKGKGKGKETMYPTDQYTEDFVSLDG